MAVREEIYTECLAGLFVPEQRATEMEIALSLNDPRGWEEALGGSTGTASGISVNPRKSLGVPAVWQAINLIAGDCGALPLSPYSRTSDNVLAPATSHWTHSLTRWRANDDETSQEYWETITAHALLWGNGYGLILRDGSQRASELLHLLPDRTRPMRTESGSLVYVSEIAGSMKAFSSDDVLHVRGVAYSEDAAPDFIQAAKETIATALAAQNFQAKFFKSGGRTGGILELPAGMPKPARDAVEEGFRKTYEGTDNSFKTVILRENAKFHAAQTSPREAQMVEASEQKVREVARFFNLPPSKLGLADGASYNGKAEDGNGYLTHCLRRWLLKIQGQCWLRLLTPSDQKRIEFRHDTDELLRMDFGSRATAYQMAITNRWMSPNEVRAREGLPPYAGGDAFENPNTISPGAEKLQESPPADPPPTQPAPKRSADELRALFGLTAVARHKSKNRRAFMEWVDNQFQGQSQEWRGRHADQPLPEFFTTLAAEFVDMVATITEDQLTTRVDQICTTFEGESL